MQNWPRPAPKEYDITYNHGHDCKPGIVVDANDIIYIVEVKGKDKLNDPDAVANKKHCVQYCAVASRQRKANGHKE